MKRGSGLKRRAPLKAKQQPKKPRKRINPVNRKRKAKMHARNFGEEADFVRGWPCEVTKRVPVDAAHTKARGMGGAGGDRTMLVPLHREVHTSFDNDSEAVFLRRWGRTKDSVRERAVFYNAAFHAWKQNHPGDVLSF